MPGIEDIARELKVSASLVSKVLNGRMGTTRVSQRTLMAIREQADSIGYQRNASAAALAMGKQNAIGVFIHRLGVAGSGIIEALVESIANEANAHDQRLNLQFFHSVDQFLKRRGHFQPSMMDGMIVGGLIHGELEQVLTDVQRSGVSVVTLYDKPLSDKIPNVGCRQSMTTEYSTRHLIEQGCQRIAHIGFDKDRRAGYKQALAAANRPYYPEIDIATATYEYHDGVATVEDLASRGIQYDGIVAQSDQIAVGAMNTLIARGVRVPEDVKIIGVDDSPFCPFAIVPLSSVCQEETQRGRLAVEMLLRQIAREPVESVLFEPTLVARKSSLAS